MGGNWAKRLEHRTRSNLVMGVLLLVSTIVSAVLVLGTAGMGVASWWQTTMDWRDQEYEKLTSLHAGYTRAKFESVLGEPVFDRKSRDARYREQTFRRREHWVQTISDRDGTVQLYAVTACGNEFRPRFELPSTDDISIELNHSRFDALDATAVDYFGSGATGNSRFLNIIGSSNPSNYKTFIWGLNDVCSDWYDEVYPALHDAVGVWPIFRGTTDQAPPWIARLQAFAIANTYAETAPTFDINQLQGSFQVGADRILTRTTDD